MLIINKMQLQEFNLAYELLYNYDLYYPMFNLFIFASTGYILAVFIHVKERI